LWDSNSGFALKDLQLMFFMSIISFQHRNVVGKTDDSDNKFSVRTVP